jgi:hypothetical protein
VTFDTGISFINRFFIYSILFVVDTMMTEQAPHGIVDHFLLVDDLDGPAQTTPEDIGEEINDVHDEYVQESRGNVTIYITPRDSMVRLARFTASL